MGGYNFLIIVGVICLISSVSAATTIEFNPVPTNPAPPVIFNYTIYTSGLANTSFIIANVTYSRLDLVVPNCFKNNTNINGVSFAVINLTSTVSSLQVNATNTSQLFGSGATRESLFDVQFYAYNGSYANNDSVTFDASTTQWYGNTSTKDTGYNAFDTRTNGWINSTVTNSVNTQDIVMAAAYNLVITVTSTADGLPIPGVTITDQSNQTVLTDGVGIGTLTEPYSTVTGTLVATGYVSRSWSIVVDNDTWVTYQMTPVTNQNENTNIIYSQQQTRFIVQDSYGNPVIGANITAYYISSTLPSNSAEVLQKAFGINTDIAELMLNSSIAMSGATGSDGSLTFMVFPSITYNFTITNVPAAPWFLRISPRETEYTIHQPLVVANSSYTNQTWTNITFDEPNASYIRFKATYYDPSGMTTNVKYFVVNPSNYTLYYTIDLGNPGFNVVKDYNYTGPNVRGESYWAYFNTTP